MTTATAASESLVHGGRIREVAGRNNVAQRIEIVKAELHRINSNNYLSVKLN